MKLIVTDLRTNDETKVTKIKDYLKCQSGSGLPYINGDNMLSIQPLQNNELTPRQV